MENQSFGRPQRPKGASIKQALKVVLVLAVCAWLTYQIKHSWIKTQNNGSQTKLVTGHGAILFGRKGILSRLDKRALPDAGNVDSVGEAKESSGGRDNVSDRAKEDKAEKEHGHINEKFRTSEGKEVDLKPESQPPASSKIKSKDLSKEKTGKVHTESRTESGHKELGNDKEKEVQLKELPDGGQVRKNAKSNFSVKENGEDEDLRIKKKETRLHKNVVEYASVTDEIDEVQSFHDENGVPPDGNEFEKAVGQAHILHEENFSNVSEESWPEKINIYEVTFVEDNDVEMNLQGLKNAVTADGEINMGTITHVDTSGVKSNSETGEGDSLVL